MLAQNFKTPAELGISDAEFDALRAVLGMLERGELIAATSPFVAKIPNGFHMGSVWDEGECGSVGCIMGWCRFVGGKHLFNITENNYHPRELVKGLFMFDDPRRHRVNDPAKAACALRNYLTHGEARWDEALAS